MITKELEGVSCARLSRGGKHKCIKQISLYVLLPYHSLFFSFLCLLDKLDVNTKQLEHERTPYAVSLVEREKLTVSNNTTPRKR